MGIVDLEDSGLVRIQPDNSNLGPAHGYLVITVDDEHQLRYLLNQRQNARMEADVQKLIKAKVL